MIVLWLGELITDYGLGNGASLLIYTNIISNLPNLTKTIFLENNENLSILSEIGIALLIFGSLYGIVFLQEGVTNYSINLVKTIKSIIVTRFSNK